MLFVIVFCTNTLECFLCLISYDCQVFSVCKVNDSLSSFRVAVLDKVTDFLLFLGKLLIVGLVGESVYVTLILNA